jgi:hypothetical protein
LALAAESMDLQEKAERYGGHARQEC